MCGFPGLYVDIDALEPEQRKLEAELSGPALADVGVDSGGVGLQGAAVGRRQRLVILLGELPKAHGAHEAIGAEGCLTEILRQPPGADAAPELHLPEAILGVGVSLAEVDILACFTVDVGYPVLVPDDLHRRREAGDAVHALCVRKGPSNE